MALPSCEARTPSPPMFRDGDHLSCDIQKPSATPRLVFLQGERGLQSLNRGWRTPDPSPAPGLPKCAASYPFIVDTGLQCNLDRHDGADHDVHNLKKHVSGRSRRESSMSTIPNNSRSISVESRYNELTSIRTPSPSQERHGNKLPVPAYQVYCVPCAPSASVFESKGSDVDTCVEELQQKIVTDDVLPDVLPVKPTAPFQISMGSKGHPYSCADACKFAAKTRGCKDGADCDHCHLCKWFSATAIRNYRGRLLKDQKPRRGKEQNPDPSDVKPAYRRSRTGGHGKARTE